MTKPQEELLRNRIVSSSYLEDGKDGQKEYDSMLPSLGGIPVRTASIWPTVRLLMVVLSIGAGSLFLVSFFELVLFKLNFLKLRYLWIVWSTIYCRQLIHILWTFTKQRKKVGL